jgi:hypothetical protein
MSNVTAIRGGITGELTPNAACIEALEDVLERARAGQVVGVAISELYHDGLAGWQLGGFLGGYALMGAQLMLLDALKETNKE